MAFWTLHSEEESSKEAVTVEDLLGCHSTTRTTTTTTMKDTGGTEMPTLDQLLEADGLLHELRLQNPLLLSFLTKRHVMHDLIDRSFPLGSVGGGGGEDPMSLDSLVHLVNGNGGDDDDKDRTRQPDDDEQRSSVCFEMLSSESSLICDALLRDEHFEHLMDVLKRTTNLESTATGRLCRILMNLLNYNEATLRELLRRHDFGTVIVGHLGNFALMDCLAKSRIVSLLDDKLCLDLMERILDGWSANAELAQSSADLFATLCRRVNAAAVPCLTRLVKDELGNFHDEDDDDERPPVREATVQAVIALCDQFLPRPFVALEMHTIGRQIMVIEADGSEASPQKEMNSHHEVVDGEVAKDVSPIIDALSTHSHSIESYFKEQAEGGPFGQLRYLLLCLFMRLIAMAATATTNAHDGDGDDGGQPGPTAAAAAADGWLKGAVLDYVVPHVLVKWPMNNHAHQAMLGVVHMAVETGLFNDNERESLACRSIESWYELEQAQTLCPGGWSLWYRLVRRLVPPEMCLPPMKNALARNAFLWIEQREVENRLRYQQFAPAVDVALRDQQLGGVSCWQEDDDEAAWLTCKEEQEKSPPATTTTAAAAQGCHDEFQSLWWCSPEDMTAFPDSPVKDDDLGGPDSPVATATNEDSP